MKADTKQKIEEPGEEWLWNNRMIRQKKLTKNLQKAIDQAEADNLTPIEIQGSLEATKSSYIQHLTILHELRLRKNSEKVKG